ncbi:MAG: rod shape-determining protein RodA [Candidatus Berkelbacteria bacterium]|nr:rod shape-determining protein RodA [Candidatus Berkelbacteria bacterium]
MKTQTIDWILYITTILIVAFGVGLIYSITYGQEATRNYSEYQAMFAVIGILVLIFLSFLDYRALGSIAYPFYGILLLFLIFLIFTPYGKTTFGATRWVNLGFFQFQPSEFFKLATIIVVAKICDREELTLKHLIVATLLVIFPVILVLKQPDFGTALILLLSGSVVIITAGFDKKYLLVLGGFLVLFITVFLLSAFSIRPFSGMLRDYQKQRIHTFLNPQKDPYGAGYNVSQSIIAVGSGGVFGRGLGYGPLSQLNFIPAKQTDFIFSVAAESFGFVGAAILLGLFFVLFLRIIRIAHKARDNFGTLLCYGIAGYFIFSSCINVGMTMGLMPTTGIPLPLVSYGGTSLVTSLAAIGICQSVMIRHKKIVF